MSLTTYYPNGQPYIVEKRVDGGFTLDGIRKGTVYVYDVAGKKISILGYTNGQIWIIEYRQNNQQHNEHGPALISWYYDDRIYFISYRQNGLRHNLHGPAYVRWYNGHINIEYHQNGYYHNLYGSAYMKWFNGQIFLEVYHFGKLIKKFKF